MRKPLLAAAMLSVAWVLPAQAAEISRIKVADSVRVNDKELKLNGLGLSKKFVFHVYAAALYVENPSMDASQLVGSDQLKRVQLTMLRDVHKNSIVEALREGFERNSGPHLPKLKMRFNQIAAAIPVKLKEKEQVTFTYEPGKGTILTTSSGTELMVEGKDFADALFAVWLGADPINEKLKTDLLTRR